MYMRILMLTFMTIVSAQTVELELPDKITKAKERFENSKLALVLEMQAKEEKAKTSYRKVLERELKSARKDNNSALITMIEEEMQQLSKEDAATDLFGELAVEKAEVKVGITKVRPSKISIRVSNVWTGTEIDRAALMKKVSDACIDPKTNTASFTFAELREICGIPHGTLFVNFVMEKREMFYTDRKFESKFRSMSKGDPDRFQIDNSVTPDERVVINAEIALQKYLELTKNKEEAVNKK